MNPVKVAQSAVGPGIAVLCIGLYHHNPCLGRRHRNIQKTAPNRWAARSLAMLTLCVGESIHKLDQKIGNNET
jgi:hypothetical protein